MANSLNQDTDSQQNVQSIHDVYTHFFISLNAIINLQFSDIKEEFFLFLGINQNQGKQIITILQEFKQLSQEPLNYLEEKSQKAQKYIEAKLDGASFSLFDQIKQKIKNEEAVNGHELFKLVDLNNNNEISMFEFQQFFQKTGIYVSDHRVREIFSAVCTRNIEENTDISLQEDEFFKAYEYIQQETIKKSLENLGINKEKLYIILIWLVIILIGIFAFIFVGVRAFGLPGAFGAIVNSIFPIAGGIGLSKSNEVDIKKTYSIEKLREVVHTSLKTIQANKV